MHSTQEWQSWVQLSGVSMIFVHTLLYPEDSMETMRERVLAHSDLELVEESGTILVIRIRSRADS